MLRSVTDTGSQTDNKGQNNKRFHVRLDLPELPHFLHKS